MPDADSLNDERVQRKIWQARCPDLLAALDAAEQERDEAREARENWRQSNYNNRVRAEAAEQERDRWRKLDAQSSALYVQEHERAEAAEGRATKATDALSKIAENAEAWHGPVEETGQQRALGVIASVARAVLADLAAESFVVHPGYGYDETGSEHSDDLGGFGVEWRESAHPEFLLADLDDLIAALLAMRPNPAEHSWSRNVSITREQAEEMRLLAEDSPPTEQTRRILAALDDVLAAPAAIRPKRAEQAEQRAVQADTFIAEMSGLITDMGNVLDPGMGDLPGMADAIRGWCEAVEKERDEAVAEMHDVWMKRAVTAEKDRDEALARELESRHERGCAIYNANPPWTCSCGLEAAEARLAETQKALRFYADESNYKDGRPRWAHAWPSGQGIVNDNGQIARAVLTTHPEAKP